MTKVFEVSPQARVYAYSEPVNMCCSFNGLSVLTQKKLKRDPRANDLFLFRNRVGNYVKILYHDGDGFCIWQKRLDNGLFDVDRMTGRMTTAAMEQLVNNVVRTDRTNKVIAAQQTGRGNFGRVAA